MNNPSQKAGKTNKKVPLNKFKTIYLVELEKTKRVRTIVEGVVKIGWVSAFPVSIYIVLEGLKGYLGQDLSPLIKFIESLKIGTILGYIWGGGATFLWVWERKGKQRAIKKKSFFQRKSEDDDHERSSSGLTSIGMTPKE